MATSHMLRRRPRRTAAATFIVGLSLACATLVHTGTSELVNRDWRLLSIRGKRIMPSFGMREPYVRLSGDSLRMSGWGGCNRISGTATADADHLAFGPILATKMACADAQLNRQESDFLAALRETSLYQILGDTLILSQDNEELARLTAGSR
ncbi:MAG TPA: META domain-containing protein [Gemmatimonadaceae bacterium]|nr:META domain-containing protein [Gemmatimonadaceae bacterium]